VAANLPTLTALEVQRNVVIEEFKQTCLNRPDGDMSYNQNNSNHNRSGLRRNNL
jgi:hypothetical protein